MKITICFYRSTKLCALGKENYRRKIWCYRMGSTVRLVPSPIINTIEWSGFCADILCVEIFKNKILVTARKKSNFSSTFLKSTALVCLGFLLLKLFLSRYDLESAFTFEVHVLVTRNLTAFFCMNTSYASKWTNLILNLALFFIWLSTPREQCISILVIVNAGFMHLCTLEKNKRCTVWYQWKSIGKFVGTYFLRHGHSIISTVEIQFLSSCCTGPFNVSTTPYIVSNWDYAMCLALTK